MTDGKKVSKKTVGNVIRAQLFENGLALTQDQNYVNLGFVFFCSKAFSLIIFSVPYRAPNHYIAGKRN